MEKKVCNLCSKRFTRQWNLERHIQDIHHISEYKANAMVKQKYEDSLYPYHSTIRYERYNNSENNTSELYYYANPAEYPNSTNHYSSYDFYNNRFYENFEPVQIDKKENKLTIRDMIRIRRALQILRNFFQRIYPNYVVIQQIFWLNYLCYTQKSIQPLKDFYKKYNLMHLWPLY
jgi:uncharacterized Zn-finger protein